MQLSLESSKKRDLRCVPDRRTARIGTRRQLEADGLEQAGDLEHGGGLGKPAFDPPDRDAGERDGGADRLLTQAAVQASRAKLAAKVRE